MVWPKEESKESPPKPSTSRTSVDKQASPSPRVTVEATTGKGEEGEGTDYSKTIQPVTKQISK